MEAGPVTLAATTDPRNHGKVGAVMFLLGMIPVDPGIRQNQDLPIIGQPRRDDSQQIHAIQDMGLGQHMVVSLSRVEDIFERQWYLVMVNAAIGATDKHVTPSVPKAVDDVLARAGRLRPFWNRAHAVDFHRRKGCTERP